MMDEDGGLPEWEAWPAQNEEDREPEPPEEEGDTPFAAMPPFFEPPPDEGEWSARPVPRRRSSREIDPIFLYVVMMALSLGLTPLAASEPNDRYTILWTLMALAGVAGLWLAETPRLDSIRVNDLLWGGALGLLVGAPLLLVGAVPLSSASDKIFAGLSNGAVFQALVFVMSPAETLFFRGAVQAVQSLPVTVLMASAWSLLLFLPASDLIGYPAVALTVGTFIVGLSVLYSYVRRRNGLLAAWLCQGVVSVLWLFVPRLLT